MSTISENVKARTVKAAFSWDPDQLIFIEDALKFCTRFS